MKWIWIFFDLVFVLCAIALIYVLCSVTADDWDRMFPLGTGTPVRVFIAPGKNGMEIAAAFHSADVVPSATDFSRWLHRFRLDRSFRPGIYTVRKGTSWEVARQLQSAVPEKISLTIVPGADIFTMGEAFSTSASALRKTLLKDENFPALLRPLLPVSADSRIAFLLPETYDVPEKTFEAFLKASSELWWARLGASLQDMTSRDLLNRAVAASLVEREAFREKERPIIAGVIENRLRMGMPLQIDATVVYAWKRQGRTIKRVLNKHLEIDSPMNTYKILGLPPEPICVPSLSSWTAAMKPDVNDYLYYVLKKNGEHAFSKNYSEHLRNIRNIRKQTE